ncbi:MAG: hypothetical protein KKA45_13210 [Alphaproteobacteria bacterium]|nr:hypothetical protein [Alphaproteobacteria bacterium]
MYTYTEMCVTMCAMKSARAQSMEVSKLIDPAVVAAESKVTETQAAAVIAQVFDILAQAMAAPGGVTIQGHQIKMALAPSKKVRKAKRDEADLLTIQSAGGQRGHRVVVEAQVKGVESKVHAGRGARNVVNRSYFVGQLGEFGSEIFDRLDKRYRAGDAVATLNVREVREALSDARLPGHGAIVRPQRAGEEGDSGDEFLVISLADISEAYSASEYAVDWVAAFAPSVGLPAAKEELKLRRGTPGRRLSV